MANRYHFPEGETKEISIELKVKVAHVGNPSCCGNEEDVKNSYDYYNGAGHVDHEIKKHLVSKLTNTENLINSDIFDVFKITVSE